MDTCIMSVQYTEECAVHRGMFSTLGNVQYTEECSVHWGCSVQWMISLSTPGGVQYSGVYHEYTRGCSVHWGFHTNSVVFPMTFPHIYHDIPLVHSWCLPVYWTPPVYSWYPPVYWTSPVVLHIPRCTAQILCRVMEVAIWRNSVQTGGLGVEAVT